MQFLLPRSVIPSYGTCCAKGKKSQGLALIRLSDIHWSRGVSLLLSPRWLLPYVSFLHLPCEHALHSSIYAWVLLVHAMGSYSPNCSRLRYCYQLNSSHRSLGWVLSQEMPAPCMVNVESIIINEKHLGHTFVFVTLMLNVKSVEPLFLGRVKDGACFREFFCSLTAEQKAGILYLWIARTNTFWASARHYPPHVKICYDPYHLVGNMNDVVVKARNHEMDQHREGEFKKVVKGTRYLLRAARQKLDASVRLRLITSL